MPKLSRVLETALYVADLDRAAVFYARRPDQGFGFQLARDLPDELRPDRLRELLALPHRDDERPRTADHAVLIVQV
jgi:catechol 2,3-dioxygenase-like lactoylglutathione lyase family enzyme